MVVAVLIFSHSLLMLWSFTMFSFYFKPTLLNKAKQQYNGTRSEVKMMETITTKPLEKQFISDIWFKWPTPPK